MTAPTCLRPSPTNVVEIRLDASVPGASFAHVVSLYEFDSELRTRLGGVLSMIETAFRFFIGYRLGRVDPFAHRNPAVLDAMKPGDSDTSSEQTTDYREWLEEYGGYEKRARGASITHFREKYGPHLPIWMATEVMSFGVLNGFFGVLIEWVFNEAHGAYDYRGTHTPPCSA